MSLPEPSPADVVAVEHLVGREMKGRFRVVVRRRDGSPVVIENEPHLRDGTPMPTLYWLVDPDLHEAVSRLEGAGGVHRYESLVDAEVLARTHEEYARRRDAHVTRLDAPAPSGGVGGTRVGVKCLHAHLANLLAGNDDPVGALVADELRVPAFLVADDEAERAGLGVIDCGSNSTRLLVVGADGRPRRREMRITRLSAGVDAGGTLAEDALARSFATLRDYRDLMDAENVGGGLLVATSAVRDARNGAEFLARAQEITGLAARILTGTEEAQFSFRGATQGLEPDARPTLVLDIGGGSTELAVEIDGVIHGYSMQLGCVRVTERALGSGVTTPDARRRTTEMIAEQLDAAFAAEPVFATLVGGVRLVGLAGTVATLAQLDAGLTSYDRAEVHHRRLTGERLREWRQRLEVLTPAQRLEVPGMVRGREDVLVAGLYILEAVMARFGVDELLSSEDDIMDGVAASLVAARAG